MGSAVVGDARGWAVGGAIVPSGGGRWTTDAMTAYLSTKIAARRAAFAHRRDACTLLGEYRRQASS
jgi:hypothetical protein